MAIIYGKIIGSLPTKMAELKIVNIVKLDQHGSKPKPFW